MSKRYAYRKIEECISERGGKWTRQSAQSKEKELWFIHVCSSFRKYVLRFRETQIKNDNEMNDQEPWKDEILQRIIRGDAIRGGDGNHSSNYLFFFRLSPSSLLGLTLTLCLSPPLTLIKDPGGMEFKVSECARIIRGDEVVRRGHGNQTSFFSMSFASFSSLL